MTIGKRVKDGPGAAAPAGRAALFARLERLGIRTQTVEHEAFFTVEDGRELRASLPGAHTKNLFLKDKKGRLWLAVVLADRRVDLTALQKKVGAARFSFARAELLREVLGVEPGSVTPFAVMNDTGGRVTVLLDKHMMEARLLNYHPLTNTATTAIAAEDLLRFLRDTGHDPVIVDMGPPDAAPQNGAP